ncbi:MAG: hypothetical protein WB502_00245 [Thermoactinomyces sp.]
MKQPGNPSRQIQIRILAADSSGIGCGQTQKNAILAAFDAYVPELESCPESRNYCRATCYWVFANFYDVADQLIKEMK